MATDSYESWAARGLELMHAHNRTCWELGDWLNEGERKWGETYAQAHDATLISYQTLANYSWVTREYPADTDARQYKDDLSFSHHKVALGLPNPADRLEALYHARELGMNRNEFAEWVRMTKAGDSAPVTLPVVRTWQGRVSAIDAAQGLVIVQLDSNAGLEIGAAVTVQEVI